LRGGHVIEPRMGYRKRSGKDDRHVPVRRACRDVSVQEVTITLDRARVRLSPMNGWPSSAKSSCRPRKKSNRSCLY
jgi:hypothetical protein